MIEYAIMDYDGEPVTIRDGKMYDANPPRTFEGQYATWNSEELEWEFEPEDCYAPYHGLTPYECNTDWRTWNL